MSWARSMGHHRLLLLLLFPIHSHRARSFQTCWNRAILPSPLVGRVERNKAHHWRGSERRRPRWELRSNDDGQETQWTHGNVYDEFDAVRRAIAIENAERNLFFVQNREHLDSFARNRHLLWKNLLLFVLAPLCFATILSRMIMLKNSVCNLPLRWAATLLTAHFWLVVVACPIPLLMVKWWNHPLYTPVPIRKEVTDSPIYIQQFEDDPLFKILNGWENTRKSCKDHILCLLEMWVSSITGAAIWGATSRLFADNQLFYSRWMPCVRFVTRLGAVASLHQFSDHLFELRRRYQPRPLTRFSDLMQRLTRSMLFWTPLALSVDLALMMTTMPVGVVPVALVVTALSCLDQFTRKAGISFSPWAKGGLLFAQGALLVMPLYRCLLGLISHFPNVFNLRNLLQGTLLSIALVGPVAHVAAVRKIIIPQHTHDLSLALNATSTEAILSDAGEMQRRTRWRFRLGTREPQRLRIILGTRWKALLVRLESHLLVSGDAGDRANKFVAKALKIEDEDYGASLIRLVRLSRRKNRGLSRFPWDKRKPWLMKRLVATHEEQYQSQKFMDPLGIAVYKVFGIGVSYNFDHFAPLQGQPTPRRLQARSAKSAVRRAQEINERVDETETIEDPYERERQRSLLRERAENEFNHLRQELIQLIPSGGTSNGREKAWEDPSAYHEHDWVYDPKNYPDWPGENEYQDLDDEEATPISYANNNPDERTDPSIYLNNEDKESVDDGFVEAWKRNRMSDDNDDLVYV